MAALALAPILSQVHVILLMTGEARRVQLDPVSGLLVTTGADELPVRTTQGEAGFLGVIELPHRPAVRGVTAGAFLPKPSLVNVIPRMAVDASLADVLEFRRQVTLLAGHRHVQTQQGKAAQVMIEARGLPSGGSVALVAVRAERSSMYVTRAVTACAVGR